MNELEMDALIEETLRSEPLAPAPAGIYPSVMAAIGRDAAVRRDSARRQAAIREASPRFRITWLDAALSLFGALMAGVLWSVWELVQSSEAMPWLDYFGMLARLNVQRALYIDREVLLASGLALSAALVAIALIWAGCGALGICSQRGERV